MFLNKQTRTTSICYFDVEKDEMGGIPNNLDEGLEFSPEANFTNGGDEYLAGILQPFRLKAYNASKDFKNNKPAAPEEKTELEKLANSLDENDNPVLILVKLKN